jgi:hypothetical protein
MNTPSLTSMHAPKIIITSCGVTLQTLSYETPFNGLKVQKVIKIDPFHSKSVDLKAHVEWQLCGDGSTTFTKIREKLSKLRQIW